MVKEQIQKELEKLIETSGLSFSGKVNVEHPLDSRHGDYSSNIAMRAAKEKGDEPVQVAQKLMSFWEKPSYIEKVEIVPPGFINFWLSKDFLMRGLKSVLKKGELASQGQALQSKKIMVEFTDPNPFKEFHVGHLYSNTVGESICRLLASQGAIVKRANYFGDVGLHVAKAVWSMKRKMEDGKWKMEDLERRSLPERVKFLGQAYAEGSRAYEEDEKAKEEMIALNKKIYEKDPDIMPLYEKGRAWSLAHFESIYQRLGTKFDYYYPESMVGSIGLNLVLQHIDDGIFVRSEGAVVFPGEQYGFHRRVFINSLGLPTYEAKELGLAIRKYEEFPYDFSLVVTGNEIVEYFRVLLAAIKKVRPDLGEKTRHLPHGMVRLPMGKMSSRTGQVITAELLLDEAKQRMLSRFSQMNEAIADAVAVGALKYALLKGSASKDVIYDINESISLEGNSGPYLQYTYARCRSVIARSEAAPKAGEATKQSLVVNKRDRHALDVTRARDDIQPEEEALLRTLHRFPEVVGEAAKSHAPNLVCSYLFDLAQKFNLFYQRHPILTPQVPIGNHLGGVSARTPRDFRLALTQAVGQTIKNGLHLLGIAAPERM